MTKKPRSPKYTDPIAFMVEENMKKILIDYAKKRKLSLSKVARDLLIQGMQVFKQEIGRKINDK